MEQIGWTSIVLSVLTLLGGCGWLIDRKKHRQEIESLKADNRQKDMNRRTSERRGQAGLDYPEREGGNAKRNLSRDYVTEWRTYIAEPLQREVGRAFCAFVHDPFETDKSCKVLSIKASRNGECNFTAIIRLVAPVTICI